MKFATKIVQPTATTEAGTDKSSFPGIEVKVEEAYDDTVNVNETGAPMDSAGSHASSEVREPTGDKPYTQQGEATPDSLYMAQASTHEHISENINMHGQQRVTTPATMYLTPLADSMASESMDDGTLTGYAGNATDMPEYEQQDGQSVTDIDGNVYRNDMTAAMSSHDTSDQMSGEFTCTGKIENFYSCDDSGDCVIYDESPELSGSVQRSNGNYRCSVCLSEYTSQTSLMQHMQTHAPGGGKHGKPFQCNVCGKRFTQKGDVKRHLRIHSGEKPYRCEACSKAFSDISAYHKHVRTHRNIEITTHKVVNIRTHVRPLAPKCAM
jgi:hypothetical protein